LSNLLNEIGNQYVNGLISMYSFLIKYKNNVGNLTNCFENLYKLLNDAREYSMEYFRNHVVTDKNYIDKKVSTHSDDVESMSIYGLEVYDLGKMKVNFASHSYDMSNSVSKEDFLRMQKEYLTYDSKSSISTISAYPIVGANTDFLVVIDIFFGTLKIILLWIYLLNLKILAVMTGLLVGNQNELSLMDTQIGH